MNFMFTLMQKSKSILVSNFLYLMQAMTCYAIYEDDKQVTANESLRREDWKNIVKFMRMNSIKIDEFQLTIYLKLNWK